MDIKTAQHDLRNAYYAGAPGVMVSGVVWLAAGLSALNGEHFVSLLVFFFGGMLIHPLGLLGAKLLKRSGRHTPGNPLATLAQESTLLIFIGLFLAYLFYGYRSHWFFPTMLMIIGSRYLLFQTMYGLRIYWLLGVVLAAGGVACFVLDAHFYYGAFFGGITEISFAVLLYVSNGRELERR